MRFTLHGLKRQREAVDAEVFGRKLAALCKALQLADKLAGKPGAFIYTPRTLGTGSAYSGLGALNKRPGYHGEPGFQAVRDTMLQINRGDYHAIQNRLPLARQLHSICQGVGRRYSHAEVESGGEIVRIDEFYKAQSERAIRKASVAENAVEYFSGTARDAFDGVIKAVDLRGAAPEVKLVLSSGGREVSSIIKHVSIEQVREALDRRVWAEGLAIYDGLHGLPARFEIDRFEIVKASVTDISRWRGTLEVPDSEPWHDVA